MKTRPLLLLILLILSITSYSQVMVNGIDLNEEVDAFEVWAVKKPFSQKESLFVNYGQDNFRTANYDSKKQCVLDKNGRKFMKGEYMKLYNYLKKQGWVKSSEYEQSIGSQEGRVIMFERKE